MPQSWPGSSGGLAPKRGPGNFDRERPHCLLRSSATMDVASNWEQNSALEIFSDGGGGGICPHCPMASPSLPGSEFVCNLLCHCILMYFCYLFSDANF